MGFYINSKDTASSPLKALAMASRSVKQPVYTAALRKYDFSELLPLAKSSNHFTALQNAFPEHISENLNLAIFFTSIFFSRSYWFQSLTSSMLRPQPMHIISPTLCEQRPTQGLESGLLGLITLIFKNIQLNAVHGNC